MRGGSESNRQQLNSKPGSNPTFTLTILMNVTDLNTPIFQRRHPNKRLTYLERFLAEQFRPDGREATECGDLFVHVGSCRRLRARTYTLETTIVCGVKAKIAEPYLEQPAEGFIGSHLLATESMTATLTRSLRS